MGPPKPIPASARANPAKSTSPRPAAVCAHLLRHVALTWAKTDDDLRGVVQEMWAFANTLEEGVVSDAAARLRNAEEALRQALERGASDEELKKLMEELRAAMNQFLQALAEEMRKNPQMARPMDQNMSRQLRSQDL